MKWLNPNTLRLDKLGRDAYNLHFGQNLFPKIAQDMKKHSKFIIFTDKNLEHHGYLDKLKDALSGDIKIFIIKPGEKSKTFDKYTKLVPPIDATNPERKTIFIALGGGVVGDLGGFIASTLLRSIPYIQIPTTTVAQADSSIGGKTGIDTDMGKNRVGTFCQPTAVYIDIATLDTLSKEHFVSGLAEWIKHAIIYDSEYFTFLEKNMKKLLHKDEKVLLHCSKANAEIKGDVVETDLFEHGKRAILNYGHTAGHPIETLMNKKLPGDKIYPHGFAISIGMMVAGKISIALETGFTEKDLQRQEALLKESGLPTVIPRGINSEDIFNLMFSDKKVVDGKITFVLPSKIGQMVDLGGNKEFGGNFKCPVKEDIIKKAIEDCF